ncbi:MAG: sigma-70 family RNA polymerase sigma factor [Roseiflexaceae bacterium]
MGDIPGLEELVRRCQRTLPEDTRAFETLVTLFKGRVYGIAYRLMGDQQEAEDQAQEVFLKVYRNIKTLDDPVTFPAWITRIATNTCLDALTRRKRRPQTTPLTPADADEPEEIRYADTRMPTPEEAALRHEVRRCLEKTLAGMEPGARAAILLRDIEDRSYQEVAETLAIGLSAAKMRIHRARVAFQALLERVCPGIARSGGVTS